jgi:hypothetical protein
MPPVGFEPKISAGERPQTYVLDRAAAGTAIRYLSNQKISGKFSDSESIVTKVTTGTMVTKLTVLTLGTKVVVNTCKSCRTVTGICVPFGPQLGSAYKFPLSIFTHVYPVRVRVIRVNKRTDRKTEGRVC